MLNQSKLRNEIFNQGKAVKLNEAGIVNCVGELLRGPQVVGFIHLNLMTGTYSVESAMTGKTNHFFAGDKAMKELQEFVTCNRMKLDMFTDVEYITLTELA